MARRRRAKNNLLPKMIAIAVLVNAILLPLLATLGVFKAKKGGLMEVKLVKLPPLAKKAAQKKVAPKKQIAKAKPHPVGRQSLHHGPVQVAKNQPHIALSKSTTDEAGGAAQGTEKMGEAPPAQQGTEQPAASLQPVATTPPVAAKPTPLAPPPVAPPQTAPHAPVYAEAEPIDKPLPSIPDDMRDQDMDTTFLALFTIRADGATNVKMIKSTGNATLDELALNAAKRWTFKPGTKDGEPVESYMRLQVEFDIS